VSYKSNLPAIVAQANALAAVIVEKTATDIAAGAKERTPPRVDTSAMLNGWEAKEVGDLEWEARNPVEYTIYNELGTRHMAAHPMLIPAAEEARPGFEAAMGQVFG
jgi:hypothetical protein